MRKRSFLFQSIVSIGAGLYASFGLQSPAGWALGNNAASYTYTGSQQGLTTNTVYTLSTYGQYLGACALQPSQSTNSGYTARCYTNYGDQNTSLYSAVAYLGVVNNPGNSFVVGDNDGNISIATQEWELSNGRWVSPRLRQTAKTKVCQQGGSVSNLTVDPNGTYLYIGCSVPASLSTVGFVLESYALYAAQIGSDGSLGPSSLVSGLFPYFQNQSYTAGLWSGVSPVMRAYPAKAPSLQGSAYSGSGAVMISGLIGSLNQSQYHKGSSRYIPASSGVICSDGSCRVAYNFIQEAKDSFSIFTAAEIGVDDYGQVDGPALYWNQVAGTWYNLENGRIVAGIDWNKTSNTLYSCNISAAPIGSPASSCGQGSQPLSWPAQSMPAAGKGYQVDISNLLFIPTPAGITTSFTQGLLTIGTYTNGYLAYHSPSLHNNSTSLFLAGNGSSGQVGNVNSLMNDTNGNLMFATSSSGLFVFNPFGGQNVANGGNMTLIPNASDAGGGAGCTLCKIEEVTEIIYYGVKTIALLAADEPPAPTSKQISPQHRPRHEQASRRPLAPMMLTRVLGIQPYRGEFRYSEQDLKALGVTKGMLLRGLSFRLAPGLSVDRKDSDPLAQVSIAIRLGNTRPSFPSHGTAAMPSSLGALNSEAEKTWRADDLKPIMLARPILYQGGDLVLSVSHGARPGQPPLTIAAFQGAVPQGLRGIPARPDHPIQVLPLLRFVP